MSETCIQPAISWLDLERYALEELLGEERALVAKHLDACKACLSCLTHLESHEPIVLPALPAVPDSPWWRRGWTWPAVAATAVATAVILLLVVRSGPDLETASAFPAQRVAVKGGDLAIELIRESGSPDVYVSGDRFKVLVTCPPGFGSSVHIVVFQDGDAFIPSPRADIDCGNRVAVPGAFRVTGNTPVQVCAAIDLPELDMATVRKQRGAALGEKTVCVTIRPAP